MTEQEREELIEKMGKAFVNSLMFDDGIRAALAVAEPVIREQCAKKCEGDFDSEMKGYGAYFAAAIRDSRNCVPEGGKG